MSHPPSAQHVVAIDFDATIAPWGPLFFLDAPFLGVSEAVHDLMDAGYRVVILTSRMSPTWWEADFSRFGFSDPQSFGRANRKYVENYLFTWNIPFNLLTSEKVPAEVYFDDRAIEVPLGCLALQVYDYLQEVKR